MSGGLYVPPQLLRSSITIDWVEIEYENGEREVLGIDRDTREVYLSAIYFPGGIAGAKRAAIVAGEHLLYYEEKGRELYLVRSGFILKHQKNEKIRRGVELRLPLALKAWEDKRLVDPLSDEADARANRDGFMH